MSCPDEDPAPARFSLSSDGRKLVFAVRLAIVLFLLALAIRWPRSHLEIAVSGVLLLLLVVCATLPNGIAVHETEAVFDYGFAKRRLLLSGVRSVYIPDQGLALIRGPRGRLFLVTSHMNDFDVLVDRLLGKV